ncbi:MAG: hypothetical protein UV38_C0001G0314 [candidate division TM6 bacterium GW2011_GWE2_42_60]|nr:MAG: hypothetical protein UV38_C0001G0314 [candidate division TM6 bacterium GW2011_GWE2_42_60]
MILSHWYGSFRKQSRSSQVLGIALVVALLAMAEITTYRWFVRRSDERAQMALSRCIELYDRAGRENAPHLWVEAARAFESGHSQSSWSPIAPYFLTFGADIALRQGNKVKAHELVTQALKEMDKNNPLRPALRVKQALLEIDADDAALQKQGEASLKTIANDSTNPAREQALYYLGLIAFDAGNRPEAENIWKDLLVRAEKGSVWAEVAQAKLQYHA